MRAEIVQFPLDRIDSRDPHTLIGLHVKGGSLLGQYDNPFVIQTVEKGPILIGLRNTGPFHTLHIGKYLLTALEAATDENPLKILGAALGRRSTDVQWPTDSVNVELRGKFKEEVFELIGLRLEGMRCMAWIWGEDYTKEFKNFGLYSSAWIKPVSKGQAQKSK
ncbi:MAG: hypothetical protein LQ341_004934 [Variospora aurantia]|nr:MAG: hypothetical protein LQ341_004934 [Variospora aurantia]